MRGGKLYRVDDQERIVPWVGKVVSVDDEIRGRRITRVDSVGEVSVTLRTAKPAGSAGRVPLRRAQHV